MAQYQIQSPDGRTVTVEGDNPPTQDDAAQIFKAIPAKTAAPAGTPTGNFAGPAADIADINKTNDFAAQHGLDPATAKFVMQNTRAGVPFDPEAALPAGVRARVSVETDPDKQAQLLATQPGILGARNVGGRVVATVAGDDGKPKDILLHPANFTDVAGSALPVAKGAAIAGAAALTDGLSLPATAGILGGTAAASDVIPKVLSRESAGQPLDVGDLAKGAAKEGVINAALPLAGTALKGAGSVFSRGAGALEENAAQAASRLGVPLTPAQATGSEVLARSTALPGTGGVALATEQKGALKAATDRALGGSGPNAVPTEAQIAPRAASVIATNSAAADNGVTQSMKDAATAAQQQIQDTLDKGLTPTNLSQSDAGKFIRGKVQALRDQFQADAAKNYGAAYDLAKKEKLGIPIEPITDLVAKINAADPQGAQQVLNPVIGQLNKVAAQLGTPSADASLEAGTMTLEQAQQLKTLANSKAVFDQAIGPAEKRLYKDLGQSLSDAIDQGVKEGSPELQSAFAKAKGDYAKDVGKFNDSDINKLFTDPTSGSHLGDSEVIPSLFRGKGNLDALQAFKNTLGANSPEYKLLLRQGVNSITDDAGTTGGLLNADKFLSRIKALSPEMQQEVLGPNADALANNARLMTVARGGKIDPDDLANALANTSGQAPKLLQAAITKQAAVDQAYNSGIMQQLKNGTLGPRSIGNNPDTFVTRFLNNASTEDAKNVMAQIDAASPSTGQMIRQRTLANILQDVAKKPAIGEATTGENVALDSNKLVQNYLTGAERDKYQAVLGPKGIQFLDDLATVHEAMAKEAVQATGSPLSGANRAAYVAGDAFPDKRGAVKTAVRVVSAVPQFALGNAQRSAAVRNFLSTGELPDIGNVARTAILAAPEAATERRRVLAQQPPSGK